MADQMYVAIVLRKKIADQAEGRAIYDLVKQKLADRPDIEVSGNVSNHFLDEEPT